MLWQAAWGSRWTEICAFEANSILQWSFTKANDASVHHSWKIEYILLECRDRNQSRTADRTTRAIATSGKIRGIMNTWRRRIPVYLRNSVLCDLALSCLFVELLMSSESSSRPTSSRLSHHSVQAEWLARLQRYGIRYAGVIETARLSRSWGVASNGFHINGYTIDDRRGAIIDALVSDDPVSQSETMRIKQNPG